MSKAFLEKKREIAVDTSVSAKEALLRLGSIHYDAVISDYQMPEMDGIQLLKVIRERDPFIPFILFTGKGREEVVIEAINNGADFYLQKGGKPAAQFAELGHKIRQAVNRRHAELSRIESEKRLTDIINFLPDATFAIDRSGTVIAWNRAIEEMTGIRAENMLGKGDYEYAIPFYGNRRKVLIDLIFEPDEVISQYYNNIVHEKNVLIADTVLPRPRGRPLTLTGKASPLYNSQGEIVGAIESIRDISALKRAEASLLNAKKDWETIFRAIGHPAVVLDPKNRIIDANDATVRLTGRSLQELKGMHCYETLHGPDSKGPPEGCPFETLKKTGSIETSEMEVEGQNGYYSVTCTPVFDAQGNLEKVIHIAMDITSRRRAEDELRAAYEQIAASEEELKSQYEELARSEKEIRESEMRFRSLFERSVEPQLLLDQTGSVSDCNDAFLALFALGDRNVIIGHGPEEFAPPLQPDGTPSPQRGEEILREILSKGSARAEWAHLKHDAEHPQILTELLLTLIHISGQPMIHVAVRDITDRKRAEDNLTRQRNELQSAYEQLAAVEEELRAQFDMLSGSERLLQERERDLMEKSELLEALLNAIPDVIGIQDRHHGIIRYNEAGYAFVGRTPDQVSGRKCYEMIGHDFPCDVCATSETYITKKPARVEKYVPELDIWLDVRSYPILDKNSDIQFVVEHLRDITAIKVAEEKIHREHEQLEEIAANIPGVVYRFFAHPDGTLGLYYVSSRSSEILGIESNPADFFTRFSEHVHPDDQRRFQDSIYDAVSTGSGWDFTGRFCKPSGEQIWIRGVSSPVRKDNEIVYSGVLLDVTGQIEKERELAVSYETISAIEEELRTQFEALAAIQRELMLSEERYRLLVENTEFPIVVTGIESGNVLFINETASRFFGVPVNEALNQRARDYWVHPGDRERFVTELRSKGRLTNYETELKTRGGEARWTLINATIIDFSGERAAYIIYNDITDKKHAEHALQRSQSLFQTIFRSSPAATIFSRLDDGRCIDVNDQYLALVGYNREELVGRSTLDLGIWADPQERSRIITELSEKRALSNVEIQIRRKDGTIRQTLASGEIIELDGQQYILSFFFDLTTLKLADEILRQSEEKFRALFENQQNGVVIIDPKEHTILDANPAALDMIGMRKDEILGRVCHAVMCPADEGKCPITDLCMEIDHSERILATKKSGHIPIIKSVKQVRIGEKEFLIESFVSIEERRRSEEALKKANDQLNLLTSITRHDILNKITAVLGFLELAREKIHDRELRDLLDRVELITDAIKAQIEFTKVYQDVGSHEPFWQNIYDLTGSLSIPPHLSFTRECEPYDLYADPVMERVFYNLLDNSIRHGERVTAIRLYCEETDRGLHIIWEDNGVGIQDSEKEIIFSRGYGKNTGYGLFLIREILNITGITISETGEPGSGARFEIHVPFGVYRISSSPGD